MIDLLTGGNEMGSIFWAKQLNFGYFDVFDPVELDHKWKMDSLRDCKKAEARANEQIEHFNIRFKKFIEV